MSENDFYVALQSVFEQFKAAGNPVARVVDAAECAVLEWQEETEQEVEDNG